MKYVLCAVMASAIVSSAANAEPFSGPYAGVEIGLDNYEVKASDVFTTGDNFDGLSGNGVNGGVFAGYDFALGDNSFAGIEAVANLSDAKATYDDGTDRARVRAKESFGLTARLGAMVNDDTGLYAKAGWVNTRFKGTLNGFSDSDRQDAWLIGAGLETRVSANASVRIEYTRADFGDVLGSNVKNNAVRAGASFRF